MKVQKEGVLEVSQYKTTNLILPLIVVYRKL